MRGREEWTRDNLAHKQDSDKWKIMFHGTNPQAVLSILALDILLGSSTTQGGTPSQGQDNVGYLADDFSGVTSYSSTPRDTGTCFWGNTFVLEVFTPVSGKRSEGWADPPPRRSPEGCGGCQRGPHAPAPGSHKLRSL